MRGCVHAGLVSALVVAVLIAPGLARADGAPVGPHVGHLGVTLRHSPQSASTRAALTGWAADHAGPLVDHGGPVMQVNQVRAVYWFPTGYSLAASWKAKVDAWLGDAAADSGTTSNVFGDTAQYGVGYSAQYLGSAVDTQPFPASGCTAAAVCLTETQIFDELDRFLQTQGWSGDPGLPAADPTHLFLVYLPPGVTDCFDPDPGTTQSADCSATPGSSHPTYCAYHTAWVDFDLAQTFVWANLPYTWANSGCQSGQFPNNNAAADTAVDVTSHEYIEALTDPYLSAWWDSSGYEIADKCQNEYGAFLGGVNGSYWNQVVNGAHYALQLEYSNASHQCYQAGLAVSTVGAGNPGSTVEITGANFIEGVTPFTPVTVDFNGAFSPSVQVVSPTTLRVGVPTCNRSGTMTVHVLGATATVPQSLSTPTATSLSASGGYAGTTITIHGTGFVNVQSVRFDGLPATFSNVSADCTSLRAVVPSAATDGVVSVTAAGGTTSEAVEFGVLPKITSPTPRNSKGGGSITLTGSGLDGATRVMFVGASAPAAVTHDDANTIVATIPSDALTGQVTVTTADGTATSPGAVKLLPHPTRHTGAGAWPR